MRITTEAFRDEWSALVRRQVGALQGGALRHYTMWNVWIKEL